MSLLAILLLVVLTDATLTWNRFQKVEKDINNIIEILTTQNDINYSQELLNGEISELAEALTKYLQAVRGNNNTRIEVNEDGDS